MISCWLLLLQENGVKPEYGLTEKGITQAKEAGFVPLIASVLGKLFLVGRLHSFSKCTPCSE